MRRLALGSLVLLLVLAVMAGTLGGASGAQATPVRISATLEVARVTNGARSDFLYLWNRNERATPIGHAVLTCARLGAGGVLGRGIANCYMYLSLPLGKVTAAGLIHNFSRYTLVVTGGTDRYIGVRGPLFVRRVSPGTQQVFFDAP